MESTVQMETIILLKQMFPFQNDSFQDLWAFEGTESLSRDF